MQYLQHFKLPSVAPIQAASGLLTVNLTVSGAIAFWALTVKLTVSGAIVSCYSNAHS